MAFRIPNSLASFDAKLKITRANEVSEVSIQSTSRKLVAPLQKSQVASDEDLSRELSKNEPDLLSFIAVAFSYNIPIIELGLPTGLTALPGIPHNQRRSYCLGIGRSSILELHHLRDSEIKSLLQQQSAENFSPLVGLKMNVKSSLDSEALRALKQELRILGHVKLKHHENIVQVLFIGFDNAFNPILGLKFAEFGALHDVLLSRSLETNESLAFSLALDIATGLSALHACGIVHGDIKPGNVLVYKDPVRKAMAKIADFSDSMFVQDLVGRRWQPLGGTNSWRAPECFDGKSIYDPFKSDMYSFGLCVLAILAPGDVTAKGSPTACFLDRMLWDRDEREKEVREFKNLSDTGVINSANGWLDRYASNNATKGLSHLIALSCLNRVPERRMTSTSILTLISADRMNDSQSNRLREISTHQTVIKEMNQLFTWATESFMHFSLREDARLASLHLFDLTDSRHAEASQTFQQRIYEELIKVASAVDGLELPAVDETFLDGSFTYRELEDAFADSIKAPLPQVISKEMFDRASEAVKHLTTSYMNGWGDMSHQDMQVTLHLSIKQLIKAARYGDKTSVLLYLSIAQHLELSRTENHRAPTRLWLAWATLKGCQVAARALRSSDPDLYEKVNLIASVRHGPLENRDDPTTFVERRLADFAGTGHVLNNLVTPRGNTILQFAIYNGNLKLVRQLVEERQFDINEPSLTPITDADTSVGEKGETPIMISARTENLNIFNYLLSRNPDLTARTKKGCNVLHSITWFPDLIATELAPELVSRGACLTDMSEESYARGISNPVSHVDIQGTPLRWAITCNLPNLILSLVALHLQLGQHVPDLDAILQYVVWTFNSGALGTLLDRFVELHPTQDTLSPQVLDHLLAISVQNPWRFHCVAAHGNRVVESQLETVNLLISKGGRPLRGRGNLESPWTEHCRSFLNNTIIFGAVDALEVMIEFLRLEGRDIKAILKSAEIFDGRDAIQRSIYCNRQAVFDYLLTLFDNGDLSLDFVSVKGMTALHAAAFQTANTWYIQALLERGCDPHAESEDGRTPFQQAIAHKNFEGARIIVNSPSCDKRRLFEQDNRHGYVLFGSVVGMALTNYRNEIGVREILFLHELGAANFLNSRASKTNVLHILAQQWPSARADYCGFDCWLLGWLLREMPANLINEHDYTGMAPLHWMALRGNDHGILTMLQSEKIDSDIRTIENDIGIPENMTVFDVVLGRCNQSLPNMVLQGGARELDLFQQRIKRLVALLLETDIPVMTYPNVSRETSAAKSLNRLDDNIMTAVSTASEAEDGTVSASKVSWPQIISRPTMELTGLSDLLDTSTGSGDPENPEDSKSG